ncbi:hypothetical protein R3P38DRAFT_3203251 [Favolaschia claudopus]|uniref:Cullin N-terminal domain-containing protein n=1 Tax=Favolaschia claudopus TaxID=2862362 RepID=A0AAW0AUD1_9AGAR
MPADFSPRIHLYAASSPSLGTSTSQAAFPPSTEPRGRSPGASRLRSKYELYGIYTKPRRGLFGAQDTCIADASRVSLGSFRSQSAYLRRRSCVDVDEGKVVPAGVCVAVNSQTILLLTSHDTYTRYASDASKLKPPPNARSFKGEAGFAVSLDKACREFFHRNAATGSSAAQSPDLLAKHADMLLRQSNKVAGAVDLEGALKRWFFSHGMSALDEAEGCRSANEACGFEYTNKLQRMFTGMPLVSIFDALCS